MCVMRATWSLMARMSPSVSDLVPPLPVLTPFLLTPPASTQITLAPMLAMASRILDEAPSPMAIVQITALTPMMTPSIVRAVRIMFRRKALTDTRRSITNCTWTVL